MKHRALFLIVILIIASINGELIYGQQISIKRIEMMPSIPKPFLMRNWEDVAQQYDSLVFDIDLSGVNLQLMAINQTGINYPSHENAAMVSYVGQDLGQSAEAINYMPAIIGASLSGIDKTDQYGYNWVLMAEDFFNKQATEQVYLNNYSTSSGKDWWYETMPNIFFYQLNSLYPNTGDFDQQFLQVAHRWLKAVGKMGGSSTPWSVPNINYRAWSLSDMKPLETGVKEPEAAGAIGWILYHAYVVTSNPDYLIGAEWAMEFLNEQTNNPSYELQLAYGAYVAARMNAEKDTNYDLDKILNWCFNRGELRGWGAIVGEWGNYDCSGLIGEANDAGNDYAFAMNGFQQAAALAPLIRYNEHYANAIGKWILNVANASRLFYPGFLPANQQDSEEWSLTNDRDSCIAHEAIKETMNGESPYSTGDAISGGWSSTNLALYGSSHVGYLGGILSKTNVEAILKIDLCKTDFYANSYPSFLFWNPYANDTTITINVGDSTIDIYNSIENKFTQKSVSGIVPISVPANNAIILVYVPSNAKIEYDGKKTSANYRVIDFDNGSIVTYIRPRIKALKASKDTITVNDSITIYCTVQDTNLIDINYEWEIEDTLVQGNSQLSIKAPEETGSYTIGCKIHSDNGLSDSASVVVSILKRIPHPPVIQSIQSTPGKIDLAGTTTIICQIEDDEMTYNWTTNEGTINGYGEEIQWIAPMESGNYKVYCTVSNSDGQTKDSTTVMVRDFSNLYKGKPLLYLPFDKSTDDYSQYQQIITSSSIKYNSDVFNNSNQAAEFNGSSSFLNIANNSQLNFKSGITLAGWIYSQHNDTDDGYIVSHGSWQDRWKLSINNSILRFTLNTQKGICDLDSKIQLENMEWYHFAAVYSGTDVELYIDGQLDNFISFSGDINTTDYDLTIGKARSDLKYFFNGRLDNLYLFDHALAPTDILQLSENATTTINKGLNSETLKIHHNLKDKIIYINFSYLNESKINYKIIDLTGRIIRKKTKCISSTSEFQISTSEFQQGLYLLSVQVGTQSAIHRIMIRQ